MNDEIAQAFDHPEHRARATGAVASEVGGMPDRISLRDHIVTVEIGAFQVERDTTQRLSFNLVVEVAPAPAPLEDDVDNILSYDRLTEAIATELAAERLNLLETLADRIAARILLEPQALRIFVRIEKLDRGPGALGVEIVRARGQAGALESAKSPPPMVVFLSNKATKDAGFSGLVDQLIALKSPVLLTVMAPYTPLLKAANAAGQRHIDLLAIEQNAWILVGQDPRIKVVGTRTELDWAIKQGQLCVWAPSRLVLSQVDLASATIDPLSISVWFAKEMQASELVIVDANAPQTDIPVRCISVGERL